MFSVVANRDSWVFGDWCAWCAFDRGIDAGNINNVIQNDNSSIAGQPTPAGQALIKNGLFTLAQLEALGGVAPKVPLAPKGQVDLGWLRDFDLELAWSRTFREKVAVEPSVGIYNLFNLVNYDLPGNTLTGLLVGSAGSLNGTVHSNHGLTRVGVGTGVFALGAPRQVELGLKISFWTDYKPSHICLSKIRQQPR